MDSKRQRPALGRASSGTKQLGQRRTHGSREDLLLSLRTGSERAGSCWRKGATIKGTRISDSVGEMGGSVSDAVSFSSQLRRTNQDIACVARVHDWSGLGAAPSSLVVGVQEHDQLACLPACRAVSSRGHPSAAHRARQARLSPVESRGNERRRVGGGRR